MGFLSKSSVGTMCLVTLLGGAAYVGLIVYYKTNNPQDTDCYTYWWWPMIVLGSVSMAISLVGMVGLCTHRYFEYGYATFIAFAALCGIGLGASIYAVCGDKGDFMQPGAVYEQYSIVGYSSWMYNQITANWVNSANIQQCLKGKNLCANLPQYPPDTTWLNMTLTSLQGGCCYPPSSCITIGAISSPYCVVYNQQNLCWYCGSCQGAYAHNLCAVWEELGIGLFVVSGVMLLAAIVSMMSICVRRTADDYASSVDTQPYVIEMDKPTRAPAYANGTTTATVVAGAF